jgi:hypothetical protein
MKMSKKCIFISYIIYEKSFFGTNKILGNIIYDDIVSLSYEFLQRVKEQIAKKNEVNVTDILLLSVVRLEDEIA